MTDFIDACSIIDAWDTPPSEDRAEILAWLGQEISAGRIQITEGVDKEIESMDALCHAWMHEMGVTVVPATAAAGILQMAMKKAAIYGAREEGSEGSGIGWNDLLLIITALILGGRVITEESPQAFSPQRERKNYKIPLVCWELGVPCLSLEKYATEQGKDFKFSPRGR